MSTGIDILIQISYNSPIMRNLKKYNLLQEDMDFMYSQQNGLCGICGKRLKGINHRNTHIDHCHRTERIRGLLCMSCNTRLGWLETHYEKIFSWLFEPHLTRANGWHGYPDY